MDGSVRECVGHLYICCFGVMKGGREGSRNHVATVGHQGSPFGKAMVIISLVHVCVVCVEFSMMCVFDTSPTYIKFMPYLQKFYMVLV